MRRKSNYLLVFGLWLCCLSCEKWDLPQEDFIRVQLLQTAATGLTGAGAEAEILDLSVGPIDDHGFIWSSIDGVPTINFNEGIRSLGIKNIEDAPGFSADLTDLLPNTRYFVRAYAKIREEVFYSGVQGIQTGTGMVRTDSMLYESGRSLVVTGHLTGVEAGITAANHGFCWSTTQTSPTLNDTFIELGTQRTGATFTYELDSLINGTTYYLRAFAALIINNQIDTVYGEVLTFDGKLSDVWELTAEVPFDDLSSNIGGYAVFTIGNKAYIQGFGKFFEYDPQTNEWTERNNIFGIGANGNAGFDSDFNQGFSIGDRGYLYTADPVRIVLLNNATEFEEVVTNIWQYDPGADQWQPKVSHPGVPRKDGLVLGAANKAYLGSGLDANLDFLPAVRDWWEFKPEEDCDLSIYLDGCWEEKPAPANSGLEQVVGFSIGQKIYMGTGKVTPSSGVMSLAGPSYYVDWWEYDPDQPDPWSPKAFFPAGKNVALAAFSIEDLGYVYGQNGSFWEYNPIADTWQQKASPLTDDAGFDFAVGFSIGDVGYLLSDSGSTKAQIWKYTP